MEEESGRGVAVAVLSESRFTFCKVPVLSPLLLLLVLDKELAGSDTGRKVALLSMAGELLVSDFLLFQLLTITVYNTGSQVRTFMSSSKQGFKGWHARKARVGGDWSCRVLDPTYYDR